MKILIAGDYCPGVRMSEFLNKNEYEKLLGDVKKCTAQADYTIVNLECPVVMHNAKPIEKCGPNLKCSDKGVEALKWAGFDCVTLANNHFLDYGHVGVKDTIDICKVNNIDYVGGGENAEEAGRILYKDVAGKKIAIINCCEHEFSIATDKSAGSNPLNIVQQYYAIQEAHEKADVVVVIVHGVVELFWLPSMRMIETYRFFIDAGADVVVNHHQHCYSGYEIYKNKPIFYGLGNFCFDGIGSGERWITGFMVKLNINDSKKVECELLPYRQCDDQIGVHLMTGTLKESFFNNLKDYNEIIYDRNRLKTEYLKWCDNHKDMYKSALNPLYNRFTRRLLDGSIGRMLISKTKWLRAKDVLENESHIERVRLLVDGYLNKIQD